MTKIWEGANTKNTDLYVKVEPYFTHARYLPRPLSFPDKFCSMIYGAGAANFFCYIFDRMHDIAVTVGSCHVRHGLHNEEVWQDSGLKLLQQILHHLEAVFGSESDEHVTGSRLPLGNHLLNMQYTYTYTTGAALNIRLHFHRVTYKTPPLFAPIIIIIIRVSQ